VTDSAHQEKLQRQAQDAGKLERSFSLPAHAANNRPDRVEAALAPARREGLLPVFPLGTEMTDVEQTLAGALSALRTAGPADLVRTLVAGLAHWQLASSERVALERLDLAAPASLANFALRTLVVGALRRS